MATYALIPGAGGTPWYWHRVTPQLRDLGHDVVEVDLPCDEVAAGHLPALAQPDELVRRLEDDRQAVLS